jgi:uncharacterized protein (DUF1501 family)
MDATRRAFLQNSSMALLGGALAGQAWAAPEKETDTQGLVTSGSGLDNKQKPTIVTIYLRGGCDTLSMIVPYGDPVYYQVRHSTAIPAKAANGKRGVIDFHKSDYFGLNPNMEALQPLMNDGVCMPIMDTGSTHGTRSHFEAQDYMERAAPGMRSYNEGWLNRYLYATKQPFDRPLRGLSPQKLCPRALRGKYPVLAGFNKTERMDIFEEIYSGKNLINKSAREGAGIVKGSSLDDIPSGDKKMEAQMRTADMARDIIAESGTQSVTRLKAMWEALAKTPNDVAYPDGPLSNQLSVIARLIKANVGLEVAQADYGGWDHHSGQGGVDGRMGGMLMHLAESMAAFNKDMGARMEKVLVLVMTEFGRTVHENGNNGTDHGHGAVMLAMGRMLASSKDGYYGKWTGMGDLYHGRFMPVTTDFRMVFGEALIKLYGFNPFQNDFFPGYHPDKPLNFMKQVTA